MTIEKLVLMNSMPATPVLIVEFASGVRYANSDGRALEGVLVPVELMDADPVALLERLAEWSETRGLTSDTAERIDERLASYRGTEYLRVDRGRLAESARGWVHVLVDSPEQVPWHQVDPLAPLDEFFGAASGFGLVAGVLMWPTASTPATARTADPVPPTPVRRWRRVMLHDLPDELWLILDYASGVKYGNQAGGVMCYQGVLEGVLAPLGVDRGGSDRVMGLPYPGAVDGISAEIADVIDAVLAAAPHTAFVTVDRSRLHESWEAWVHVIIDSPDGGDAGKGSVHGFGRTRGVLTWPNSD